MNSSPPVWAIIPAAGSGSRMQAGIAKQYMSFQGKTVIEHCLDRLLSHPEIDGAVVVLHDDDTAWDELEYESEKTIFIASGGEQRHHSVYNGLTTLQYRFGNEAIALVHDAARPVVSHQNLDNVIAAARQHEAGAILATPVADTLKLQGEDMDVVSTVARDRLWRAMTPQVFHLQPLLNALKRVIDENIEITDDAMAIEIAGYAPKIVAGSLLNIKITAPDDLKLAEMVWLNQRDQNNDE